MKMKEDYESLIMTPLFWESVVQRATTTAHLEKIDVTELTRLLGKVSSRK